MTPGDAGAGRAGLPLPDREPGALRFKHGITRDVVYDSTGLHLRQQLHRRIAASCAPEGAKPTTSTSCSPITTRRPTSGRWPPACRSGGRSNPGQLGAGPCQAPVPAALAALEFLPDTPERRRRWVNIAQRLGMACVFDASRDDLRVLRHAAELAQGPGTPA